MSEIGAIRQGLWRLSLQEVLQYPSSPFDVVAMAVDFLVVHVDDGCPNKGQDSEVRVRVRLSFRLSFTLLSSMG